MTGQL